MSAAQVTVVATGIANLRSIVAGLSRAGADVTITRDPRVVRDAPRLVLPGVGSFAAAMQALRQNGLDAILIERLHSERPTLAICLGLQVLAEASEESPGVAGLGVIPGCARRFSNDLVVPHLGWNSVAPTSGTAGACLDREDWYYFANSYRLETPPPGWSIATTEHGDDRFIAAVERGPVLACQFHPELSAAAGLRLISRWLKGATTCSQSA